MEYIIQGGTYKIEHGEDNIHTYVYRFSDKAGDHVIVFLAADRPEIGDRIVNGIHVPITGWVINDDTSKWSEYYSIRFPDIPE